MGCRYRIGLLCAGFLMLSPLMAAEAPVTLQWEIVRHQRDPASGSARTQALLTLTNHGEPLASDGWALYFNCASELRLGELPGHLVAEHAGGTLFRIRPSEGFHGLATNAALDIAIEHPDVVVKDTRAPTGPYLVFDRAANDGLAIHDYRVLSPVRDEQEPPARGPHAFRETAQDRYQANRRILVLPEDAYPPVLPTPQQVHRFDGRLRIDAQPRVEADSTLAPERQLVTTLFARRARYAPGGRAVRVSLRVDPRLPSDSSEAYALDCNPSIGIRIIGKSVAGVARGVASLQQLISEQDGVVTVPSLSIKDAPRFAYRGLHVDVARNFQPKEVVFHLLDLMARHKLNTLHLHLTDDEGWRLEVPGLPELTEVGARRGHHSDPLAMLPPAHGSGPDPADAHGSGYYTAADYVAILRHAADLRITVVPEIEMPGHARAAVKAMEARYRRFRATDPVSAEAYLLSDPADHSRYVSAQGFTDNVLNPALPSTYRFIDTVIEHVAALHREAGLPLTLLHVGGDELPRGAWNESPAIRQWMADAQLMNRQAVWDQFYARVAQMVESRGITVAGWEEIGARRSVDGKALEPNPIFVSHHFHTYVWNDLEGAEDLGLRLANAGYPTVLAPVTAYYFDMVHNQNPEEPGATWAPPLGLESSFDFDPEDYPQHLQGDRADRVTLTTTGAAHILGLQGTLWSETMREPERIEYLLLPRMLGLAERAWASRPAWADEHDDSRLAYTAAWSIFMNQVAKVALPALDADRAAAYRIPAPGLDVVDRTVLINHEYPGFVLRYTVDGREPSLSSPRVEGPLAYQPMLQVVAFDRSGRHGHIARITP